MKKPSKEELSGLEQQLHYLKEKERTYYNLPAKIKDLQKKSKFLTSNHSAIYNSSITSRDSPTLDEDEQLSFLKMEIQQILIGLKHIEIEQRKNKQRTEQSKSQLEIAFMVLSKLQNSNKQTREKVNLRSSQIFQYEKLIVKLTWERQIHQNAILQLRNQMQRLEAQQHTCTQELEKTQARKQFEQRHQSKLRQQLNFLSTSLQLSQKQLQKKKQARLNWQKKRNQLVQHIKSFESQQQYIQATLQDKNSQYCKLKNNLDEVMDEMRNVEGEVNIAKNEISIIEREYNQQRQELKQEEQSNSLINSEFDQAVSQALQLSRKVSEMVMSNTNPQHYDKLRVLSIWKQIETIIYKE